MFPIFYYLTRSKDGIPFLLGILSGLGFRFFFHGGLMVYFPPGCGFYSHVEAFLVSHVDARSAANGLMKSVHLGWVVPSASFGTADL